MACTGQCYIETDGMQLLGADGTVFAVQEDEERFSVMIQKGSVDFALSAEAKPVEFKTPFDTLTASPYSVPAGSESVVRGNLSIMDEKAVLTLAQGSLEVTNARGQALLHSGSAITLAQYSAGGSSDDSSSTGEDITGIFVGAATLGIIGATIAALASGGGGGGDDGGKDVSPK
jgi:ferric-dicitrate binding protein FerR (iron transport regulator)